MKVTYLLFNLFIVNLSSISQKTTHQNGFEEIYKIKHIQSGDLSIFPNPGDRVTVNYIHSEENDSKQTLTFLLKRGEVLQCFDEVVSRMNKGEKLFFICPNKNNDESKEMSFLIELINIIRKDEL